MEYKIGNCVVCVTRPELSDAERAKRERQIQIALQQFGRAMYEKTRPVEV
jgi:hypothetical protein